MEGYFGGDYNSPAESGSVSSTPATAKKTMAQMVANLSQKDAIASRINGPQLLVALRTTHAILLALMDRGEFDMCDVELDVNLTSKDGETQTLLHLDGEQVMEDNDALLRLIKKDPDDE